MNPWNGASAHGAWKASGLGPVQGGPVSSIFIIPKRYETQGQLTRSLTGTYIYLPYKLNSGLARQIDRGSSSRSRSTSSTGGSDGAMARTSESIDDAVLASYIGSWARRDPACRTSLLKGFSLLEPV